LPTPNDFSDYQFNSPTKSADRQFTSDNKTPDQMDAETANSQNTFAELQLFLNNSLETPGCRVCNYADRPWTSPHPEKTKAEDGKTGRE
jgi:hypothetical protein